MTVRAKRTVREIKCSHCSTDLEYEFNDIRREQTRDHILELTITKTYIICPICKGRIILSDTAKSYGNGC